MFPLVGQLGFMKSGGDFRYLHDEISGGLIAISHLKTLESYSGDALILNTGGSADAYGFVDNFVDLASAQTDYPAAKTATVFDQINNQESSPGLNNAWNGSDFLSGYKRITGAPSITFSDPKTIVYVVSLSTLSGAQGLGGLLTGEFVYQNIYLVDSTLFIRKRNGGSSYIKSYTGIVTGLQIIVWTDDGSLSVGGQDVYINDMVTSVTAASSTGSVPNQTLTVNDIGRLVQSGGPQIQGLLLDYHVFNKVLSESERNTLKSILEQYYTFS